MDTREQILSLLGKSGSVRGRQLVDHLGISRQAVHVHLKKLIEAGEVVKTGSTRGAVYSLATGVPPPLSVSREYPLVGLEEDRVFDELARQVGLARGGGTPALSIVRYAFTELLNNAIEHSGATRGHVTFVLEPYDVVFTVRDRGIGIFHSIATRFELADENAAVGELLKGKTTTMRERHSGEGVFFTSKVADELAIRSHRTRLVFRTRDDDVFVQQKRHIEGTEVVFRVRRRSRKRLREIFERYSPEKYDYQFERTKVGVKLFETEYVSRSEARRLTANLEKFREVVLDFKGVASVGQAFADEVFRVFPSHHPSTRVVPVNVSQVIEPMIRHVIDKRNKEKIDN